MIKGRNVNRRFFFNLTEEKGTNLGLTISGIMKIGSNNIVEKSFSRTKIRIKRDYKRIGTSASLYGMLLKSILKSSRGVTDLLHQEWNRTSDYHPTYPLLWQRSQTNGLSPVPSFTP